MPFFFFSIFVAILWNKISFAIDKKGDMSETLPKYPSLLCLFHVWFMLGRTNLGLELVRFAFSAETSTELEAFHWKYPASVSFQQLKLKPSSPKWGTALSGSPVSNPVANGLWGRGIKIIHLASGWHDFLKEQFVTFPGKAQASQVWTLPYDCCSCCHVGNGVSFVEGCLLTALGY